MPFHVSALQGSSTINNGHINSLSSADTSPEMCLWEQAKTFFDPIQESHALACIRTICRPPAGTTQEALINQFEQLRALAYPGYRENIQSGRHGENHFCILGENGQQILSVTLGDTGTYEVEYEGHRIKHPLPQRQQERKAERGNTAEAPTITSPLTAEEYEAIWSDWAPSADDDQHTGDDSDSAVSRASSYTDVLRDSMEAVKKIRDCLRHNDTTLTLNNLYTLSDLPRVLPPHITGLTIENAALTHLPPLPPGLQTLNLGRIPLDRLPVLPQGLRTLNIETLNITELPELPPGLQTLNITDVRLAKLPTLPNGLTELIARKLDLTSLPPLPPGLQTLHIDNMSLTHLPLLPSGLQMMGMRDIRLSRLPPLPPGLQTLEMRSIPLSRLPPLPPTLQFLAASNIPLIGGLEGLVNLSPNTIILLRGSTMSARMLQTLHHLTSEPGYSGPRIHFDMAEPSLPRETRALHLAVADWLTPVEGETTLPADRWKAFEQENHAPSFSLFLDRLSDTENFRKNSAFKAQISSWLTQLPEDDELRAKTVAMAAESTSSCEDRVTMAMNQMKTVQLVHQAEKGLFDEHIPELVAAGREMFRLAKLEEIARKKTKTLRVVDEIEVWLGYQNRLKESLGLTSVTAEMHFFNISRISESDLQSAEVQVKTAENSQFPAWILQWAPLRSLLQRTEPERWNALVEKKSSDYEHQYQALSDTELKPAGLVGDTEAVRTIGTRVMASAEKAFLDGLRVLTEQKLAGHLEPHWR